MTDLLELVWNTSPSCPSFQVEQLESDKFVSPSFGN